jgi:hypothetical protein
MDLSPYFERFQRFRRGRAPPVAFIIAASPMRPPGIIISGKNPPRFGAFRFGGIFSGPLLFLFVAIEA